MKIDFRKIARSAAHVAAPIVAAAVVQRVTTGKLDVRALLLSAAQQALAPRPQV